MSEDWRVLAAFLQATVVPPPCISPNGPRLLGMWRHLNGPTSVGYS